MTRQEMAALLVHAMKDLPGTLWKDASGGDGTPAAPELASWQQELKDQLLRQETSFSITLEDDSAFEQIKPFVDGVMADNDYLHYVYGGMKYVYDGRSTVTFTVEYNETKEQSDYVAAQAKTILQAILKPGMNDFDKEKAIHDYVVSHVAYDQSLTDHTAYGALTKGTAVCQGYALLTFRLLDEAGIPNKIVEGEAGGQLHTWNVVKLDGSWYQLDTTWDDPVPDVKGRVLYNYFNLTDDQLRHDHRWTGTYPAATTDFAQTLAQAVQSGGSAAASAQALLDATGLNVLLPANSADTVSAVATILKRELSARKPEFSFRFASALGSAPTVMKGALTNSLMADTGVAKVSYEYGADTRTPGYTNVTVHVSYD